MKVYVLKLLAPDASHDHLKAAYTSFEKADEAGQAAMLKDIEQEYRDYVSYSIRPLEVE